MNTSPNMRFWFPGPDRQKAVANSDHKGMSCDRAFSRLGRLSACARAGAGAQIIAPARVMQAVHCRVGNVTRTVLSD